MKKAVVFLIAIVAISSCSLFEKPSMTQEEIDALKNQKAAVEEKLANLQQQYELVKMKADECAAVLAKQAEEKEAASGKYLVIAGSFKQANNADNYSATVKKAGGLGTIVQGPSNFKLVVYSAHPNLKEAAKSMYSVRSGFSEEAWIYMGK